MDIGIKKMRIFLSVIEENSFTKAARKNNVSQPATTITINQIEDIVGAPLFKKVGNVRQTQLTEEGEKVSEAFRRLVMSYDFAVQDLNFRNVKKKITKVSIQQNLSNYFSHDYTDELLKIFSTYKLEISEFCRNEVISSIRARQADIGFVDGFVDDPTMDYVQAAVVTMGLLFNPEAHPVVSTGAHVEWSQIDCKVMILSKINRATHEQVKSRVDEAGISLSAAVETDSPYMVSEMVKAGHCAAIMPPCCVPANAADQGLRFLPIVNPVIEIPLGFVTPKGHVSHCKITPLVGHCRGFDRWAPVRSVAGPVCDEKPAPMIAM